MHVVFRLKIVIFLAKLWPFLTFGIFPTFGSFDGGRADFWYDIGIWCINYTDDN